MFYLCDNDEDQELIETDDIHDVRLNMANKGGRWTSLSPGGKTMAEAIERWKLLPDPCVVCGHLIKSSYQNGQELVAKNMCFSCNIWDNRVKELTWPNKMVVNGCFYTIASESESKYFRGFGGSKFVFKRLDNGELVESTNVWSGGHPPKIWLNVFKDNAIILR